MSLIEAFIFGLLQGLTEFFPISSSAHLKLAKLLCHLEKSESQVVFDLVCHLGTLLALLHFLRKEIVRIFLTDRRKLFLLFAATLPLIPCYFLLKPLRDLASEPQFLGPCLICTAFILFLGQKIRLQRTTKKEMHDVLMIGMMQSAALIPGISRSASTISCAKVLGWKPREAVRFSFLLSIPTIIGGNCLELLKIYLSKKAIEPISLPACGVGFFASLGFGLLVIRFALSYLEKGNLRPFAWYCLLFGITAAIYINFIPRGI
jgi:undecaprenyl-diphosphatase